MLHVPALAATAILAVVLRPLGKASVRRARSLFEDSRMQKSSLFQAAFFSNAACNGLVPANASRVEAAGGC